MRRIALLLLIALLPLQSIWAAAANACQGGCSSGGGDFGHHEHAHAGGVIAADDASPDTPGGPGATNHDHGSAAVIVEAGLPVTASGPGIVPSPYQQSFADCYLESPLRPPLQHLA